MGFFDSKTKNTTNAYDQSVTATTNESVSGADTNLDNSIFARNSDFSSADYSTAFADNSYNDSSTRTSSTDNRDSSNNSFNLDTSGSDYSTDNSYLDSSSKTSSIDNRDSSNNSLNLDMSGSDYSTKNTSTTSITDGGSFSMVSGIMGKMIDSFTGSQNKLADLVGLSQKSSLSATNDFVSRSMDAQKQTSGVAELVSQENGKLKLIAGAAIAAAGLFAAYKWSRGR